MKAISFTVPGKAYPAGSHKSFHGRITHVNPKLKPWMDTVKWFAMNKYEREVLISGPVELELHFTIAYRKGDYGTGRNADKLKPSAPTYHTTTPDLTKLIRAVEDALTGIIWKDDKQVWSSVGTKKYGHKPQVEIIIKESEDAGV